MNYDALFLVSFGGPEQEADIMPFLENVVRRRRIPKERLEHVAEHYRHFGGSPINQQNRELIEALTTELSKRNVSLPIYFGNRNWNPFISEAISQMQHDGKKKVLSFFTSMFSCFSGCRQYRENISEALSLINAPLTIDKVRMGYNHPRFIAAVSARIRETLETIPTGERKTARLVFTAHSIPNTMAEKSGYQVQLLEASRLIAQDLGISTWELAYQSRSGSPQTPWLEPDISDALHRRATEGEKVFLIVPIGFVSDHIEILWDLDSEAKEFCKENGLQYHRAPTVGTHPEFVGMIADLIQERLDSSLEKKACGRFGPNHDVCPEDCCLPA